MRYLVRTCLAMVLLVTLTQAQPAQHWQRSIKVEQRSTAAPHEVELVEVGQRDILFGGLYVRNELAELDSRGSVMTIGGHQKSDGTFWPTVELQVQKEENGKWITIGSSESEQPLSQLQIYSGTMVAGLRVNLDPFKPYLDKFTFGRIVLVSGDEAPFKLDDLKPPSNEKNK